jgi:hypothetical protein
VVLLSEKVRMRVYEILPGFEGWLGSENAKNHMEGLVRRVREFRGLLSEENIERLTESDLRKIITSLFASNIWANKDYVVNRILANKDIDALRSELKKLLYGGGSFSERYDNFTKNVKGLGPAALTEILAFFNPLEYGIWNEKSRKALEFLGLGDELQTRRYRITGLQYERFNQALKEIYAEIKPVFRKLGMVEEAMDLLFVDVFLYYICKEALRSEEVLRRPAIPEDEDYDFDHDEIVEKLVELGNGLGFEAESEKLIARGARVDVVWRARIANLGMVSYVFEVHRGGSIDSLILNLQRARNDPTVQKLVVVANTKDLKRIGEEISSLSEDFRKSIAYMEAKDVEKAYDLLKELNTIIGKLELVKSS